MNAQPVETRELPRTSLKASPITLGTSYLGRGTVPGGPGEQAAVEFAEAMLSGPYALVDTSNEYAQGRSEAVLGIAASAGIGPGRAIVTKTDRDVATGVFDEDRVLWSFEESCTRLGVERIPLLHLHDPYSVSFEEATGPRGAVAGMLRLKDQGLVDAIGIAAGRVGLVAQYVGTGLFDALLTHNRYTIVDQSALPLIEEATSRGMAVFNAAPFGGNLLAKGAASGGSYNYTASPPALLEWVARAEDVAARHGVTLPAVALHYSLRSPMIHSTVVGVSKIERIAELERLRTTGIPDELWADLEALGPAPSPVTD
ncbi:aldo/keto reductase [Lysobacter korlensis]|uniref:Aldo/keto reductase n=1 Tax=Lysobacter korlensis TaxID=553636 RepID=A0ABV6RT71_9GAMM